MAGFLADVTTLLTARSRLRKRLLDTLHDAGVEIVSPTFMNQRQVPTEMVFVPPAMQAGSGDGAATAEQIVFDKADAAAAREALRDERKRLETEIADLEAAPADAPEDAHTREADLETRRSRLAEIESSDATGSA